MSARPSLGAMKPEPCASVPITQRSGSPSGASVPVHVPWVERKTSATGSPLPRYVLSASCTSSERPSRRSSRRFNTTVRSAPMGRAPYTSKNVPLGA